MNKTKCIVLGLLLCGLSLVLPSGDWNEVRAEEESKPEETGIILNWAGVKLGTLLEYFSKREGKPLLLEETFPRDAPVNLISPPGVSIPADKLFDVIESILRMKGFALITTGPVIKVVRSREAKEHPITVRTAADLAKVGYTDRIITQIIPLKYAAAQKIASMLSPLKSKEAPPPIISVETNTLVLTDFASNIRRMYEIIQQLDQEPVPYQTRVNRLKHSSATEVKKRVDQYIQAMAQAKPPRPGRPRRPFVTIDERVNSIIVFALQEDLEQISNLIDLLDTEAPEKESTIHTYKLSNTSAEDVAKIVESIFTKQQTALPALAKRPGEVISIMAEKSSNSLIVTAPPALWVEMEKLIKKIDVRKLQVLLESAIVELSMGKMVELGIELATIGQPAKDARTFASTGFGLSKLDADTGKIPIRIEGMTVGIWKHAVGNIPFLLRAAQKDTDINVMAAPSILTNDNSEAIINISDMIPYDTITISTQGTESVTFGGYLDAGIKLTITPHISEDGYLRLEIEQIVEQFFSSTYSETRPAKTKRTAKTTVTIPDKDTVIIGGLTRDSMDITEKKIPLLGDIPLLGALFRWTKKEGKKTNLCIFITPHIIREFSELIEETGEHKESLERLKERD